MVKIVVRSAEISSVDDALDVAVRCPRCQARVSGGASWCSLCYADLRVTTAASAAPAAATAPVGLTAPAVVVQTLLAHREGWGQGAAGGASDGIDAMLAMLAAESGPPLGVLPRRLGSSKGMRVGLMVGGLVGCTAVIFVLMTLLGLLL